MNSSSQWNFFPTPSASATSSTATTTTAMSPSPLLSQSSTPTAGHLLSTNASSRPLGVTSLFPTPIGRPLTSGRGGDNGPMFGQRQSSSPPPLTNARPIRRMSPITTWNASNPNGGGNSSAAPVVSNGHTFAPMTGVSSSYAGNNNNNNNSNNGSTTTTTTSLREAGIVEKLLPSYGFIQCCERQARLFFHYSQFGGNIEHLKLGDPVEFEMTYDRRTGKPIASSVNKISNEVFPSDSEVANPDQPGQTVNGFITTEPYGGKDGRVAYENRGECFFLPFTLADVEPSSSSGFPPLQSNDKVSFRIATDRSGNLRARKLSLLTSTPDQFQGIVCTLKDSFGFIERADVVREIFFHSSECPDFKSLNLGDDVEFGIQTRNDKKVAVNVRPLEPGTVVFESVSEERVNGVVMKMATRAHNSWGRQQYSVPGLLMAGANTGTGDSGVIRVMSDKMNEDIAFAIKDINGDFSVKEGDIVTLNVVTDKRDNMKHAGKISLHSECFRRNGEHRDQGYVASLKDNYGFIKCFNREGTRVYFKIAELLNPNLPINMNDEVEFTLSPDVSSPGRFQATRISILPNGSIIKSLLSSSATTTSARRDNQSSSSSGTYDYPLIDLDADDAMAAAAAAEANGHSAGRFSSNNAVRSDTWTDILSQIPIEIPSLASSDLLTPDAQSSQDFASLLNSASGKDSVLPKAGGANNGSNNGGNNQTVKRDGRGVIAAVKSNYGFINYEGSEDGKTLFFHMSEFRNGMPADLKPGDAVEFAVSHNSRTNKFSATALTKSADAAPRQRPEHLISKLKLSGPDLSNKIVAIRQPKGPDGSKGFAPRITSATTSTESSVHID